MRNFTLIAALMLLTPTMVTAQKTSLFKSKTLTNKSAVAKQGVKQAPAMAAKKASGGNLVLPCHEETFYYDDGEWFADGTYELSYDKQGNVVKQVESYDDGATQTTYEYNNNGMEVTRTIAQDDGEGNFVNSTLLKKEYDEKVSSLVTSSMEYTWNNNDWQLISAGRTWKRDVSRNDDENVTGVSLSTYYNGDFDETYRSSLTYDSNGAASTWKYEELAYDEATGGFAMQPIYTMKNIKWANTNGQIVNFEMDEFFTGDNRVAAATVIDEEDQIEGQLTATYEDNGNYTYHLVTDTPASEGTCYYTIDDANGSFTKYSVSASDTNSDGRIDSQDETYSDKYTVEYDEHGNIVAEASYEDGEITFAMKYEYEYGNANSDYPTQQIHYEYDIEADEYLPLIKVVSSDYIDVTNSISTIEAANNTKTTIYNLQGMSLNRTYNNLPAGIYIVRNGNKTSKILKK